MLMKRFMFILAILLIASIIFQASLARADGIYFDDSNPDIMVLSNDNYYKIGFRKSNGAIDFITDKSTGQNVTSGSRKECLWGAVFPDGTPDYVGGCNYNAIGPNNFSYAWSAATHTLTLNYTPDRAASQQVWAQVVVNASESPWFDMRLQLQNNWDMYSTTFSSLLSWYSLKRISRMHCYPSCRVLCLSLRSLSRIAATLQSIQALLVCLPIMSRCPPPKGRLQFTPCKEKGQSDLLGLDSFTILPPHQLFSFN
jgi:hypothetical protein